MQTKAFKIKQEVATKHKVKPTWIANQDSNCKN